MPLEKREQMLSLFFAQGFGHLPPICNLLSMIVIRKKSWCLVLAAELSGHDPGLEPWGKSARLQSKRKTPTAEQLWGFSSLELRHHQDFKREYPLTIFIVWVLKFPTKSIIFIVWIIKLTIDVIFKTVPFVI